MRVSMSARSRRKQFSKRVLTNRALCGKLCLTTERGHRREHAAPKPSARQNTFPERFEDPKAAVRPAAPPPTGRFSNSSPPRSDRQAVSPSAPQGQRSTACRSHKRRRTFEGSVLQTGCDFDSAETAVILPCKAELVHMSSHKFQRKEALPRGMRAKPRSSTCITKHESPTPTRSRSTDGTLCPVHPAPPRR